MADKETLRDFQRTMAPQIAEAEAVCSAAILHDPHRDQASMKEAMAQYILAIRRLVNEYLKIPA